MKRKIFDQCDAIYNVWSRNSHSHQENGIKIESSSVQWRQPYLALLDETELKIALFDKQVLTDVSKRFIELGVLHD